MKFRKLLAISLAVMTVSACSAAKPALERIDREAKDEPSKNGGSEIELKEYTEFPSELKAKKIGTLPEDINIYPDKGGVSYRSKEGKHGVLSFDGKNDTGAIYTYLASDGVFFKVSKQEKVASPSVDVINSIGVVDGNGRVVVPMEYAAVKSLNERFIQVCKASEETTSKDEAVMYIPDSIFSITADEGDKLYKGTWYVYDAKTGEMIEGLTGTSPATISARGNIVSVSTAGKSASYRPDGSVLEADIIFPNGYYKVTDGDIRTLCDDDDKEIFSYNTNDYDIMSYYEDFGVFLAGKYDGGKNSYFIVDNTGKIISSSFDRISEATDKFIFSDNMLYDYEGNKILQDSFEHMQYDSFTKQAVMLYDMKGKAVIIDSNGEVLFEGEKSDTSYVNVSTFTCEQKDGSSYNVYCVNDKGYTLKGNSSGAWTAICGETGKKELVDTISGKTIIDGYSYYYSHAQKDGAYYVYAEKENKKGFDIYLVS